MKDKIDVINELFKDGKDVSRLSSLVDKDTATHILSMINKSLSDEKPIDISEIYRTLLEISKIDNIDMQQLLDTFELTLKNDTRYYSYLAEPCETLFEIVQTEAEVVKFIQSSESQNYRFYSTLTYRMPNIKDKIYEKVLQDIKADKIDYDKKINALIDFCDNGQILRELLLRSVEGKITKDTDLLMECFSNIEDKDALLRALDKCNFSYRTELLIDKFFSVKNVEIKTKIIDKLIETERKHWRPNISRLSQELFRNLQDENDVISLLYNEDMRDYTLENIYSGGETARRWWDIEDYEANEQLIEERSGYRKKFNTPNIRKHIIDLHFNEQGSYLDYLEKSTDKKTLEKEVFDYAVENNNIQAFNWVSLNSTDDERVKYCFDKISETSSGQELINYPLLVLKLADEAIKSGDEDKINNVNNILHSCDDATVFDIDRQIMGFLMHHFNDKMLESVNNLRGFYGLKTIVADYDIKEANLRAVERLEFMGMIGITDVDSQYYNFEHSATYRSFKPDYDKQYEPKDYDLTQSDAVKILLEHDFKKLVKKLPHALADSRIPPDIVNDLNVKDLSAILIESEYIDTSFRSMVDISEITGSRKQSIREQFWMDVAKDEELVYFISKDLLSKGISQEDIDAIWENAKTTGSPNYGENNERNVSSVYLQVHHRIALKDGGKNEKDNFIIVLNIPDSLNTHNPLHQFDTPLDFLCVTDDEKYPIKKVENASQARGRKRKKIYTVMKSDVEHSDNNLVRYYGGASEESIYVGDIKNRKLDKKVKAKIDMLKNKIKTKISDMPIVDEKHKNTNILPVGKKIRKRREQRE